MEDKRKNNKENIIISVNESVKVNKIVCYQKSYTILLVGCVWRFLVRTVHYNAVKWIAAPYNCSAQVQAFVRNIVSLIRCKNSLIAHLTHANHTRTKFDENVWLL